MRKDFNKGFKRVLWCFCRFSRYVRSFCLRFVRSGTSFIYGFLNAFGIQSCGRSGASDVGT